MSTTTEPTTSADIEIVALAVMHAAAATGIRRLEATRPNPDAAYRPMNAQRQVTLERAAQLEAASLAGLQAKASIVAGDLELVGEILSGAPVALAASLARDVVRILGAPPAEILEASADAEIIAACHDFLAAEEELGMFHDDEWEREQEAIGAITDRSYAALERLTAAQAQTRAGAQAKAYAAHAALVSADAGVALAREGSAALSALADMSGRIAA